MSSYRRIFKKKLKEQDELVTTTSTVLTYIRKNSKTITFIALIALISISTWAGFMIYKDRLDKTIHKDIYETIKTSTKLQGIPQEKIDNLKKLEERYFNKDVYLNLYLGHFYYKNKKYENASSEYKKILETKSSSLIRESASIGLGYSYEASGKYKDAINILQNAINNNSLLNKEEIYITIGRLYEELGDYKSAIEKYQFIIDNFPNIPNIEMIKEKTRKLKTVTL
jgi:tetratricopeptide (TPR) repeat protein